MPCGNGAVFVAVTLYLQKSAMSRDTTQLHELFKQDLLMHGMQQSWVTLQSSNAQSVHAAPLSYMKASLSSAVQVALWHYLPWWGAAGLEWRYSQNRGILGAEEFPWLCGV